MVLMIYRYITIEVSEIDPTFVKMLIPFSADQVFAQSLLDTFAMIVRSMATNPHVFASEVLMAESPALNTPEEELPTPSKLSPVFGLAHSAFESVATATPTKTALRTSTGRVLSYGELNSKANSFANFLISQDVQHGEMIPLYMEKSVETLISILGILKAGASFTPLDPLNPHDRNAFIVKDVGALRIVSDRKNREACAAFGAELIITEDMDLSSNGDQNPRIPELTPESVIYAIYTSGSTVCCAMILFLRKPIYHPPPFYESYLLYSRDTTVMSLLTLPCCRVCPKVFWYSTQLLPLQQKV